jgi:hypothetical protein
VIGDVCFALDNPAIWRFSTPNVYLPFNGFGIWTDKHFEFHVRAPSLPLIGISEPAGGRRQAGTVIGSLQANRGKEMYQV